MKAQNTAEKLLRTENEHWNRHALRFLVQVKESGLFPSEDQALELYREVVDTAAEHHAQPLKAERAIGKLLEKLTEEQRLQIYQGAHHYLKQTDYGTDKEEVDLSSVLAILKVRTKQPESPSWGATARTSLRDLVRKELDLLPTTLSQLEAKDRVAALCKLIPYVLPKGEEQPRPTVTTW
jgi:hypothetical protein